LCKERKISLRKIYKEFSKLKSERQNKKID
jgi:hypothetical protein